MLDTVIADAEKLAAAASKARREIGRVIHGQEEVVEQALVALLAGGHALLIGVPGLGKTLLVDTLGRVLGLDKRRIQFTPDLMPADITGSEVLDEDAGHRSFRFVPGPVFCQLLMADEINRASPRTQSALLQAMQEKRVAVSGVEHALPSPFHVLATQNPIEQEGTYPLPEAQLDRFLMKVLVRYPSEAEERQIYRMTSTGNPVEPTTVLSGEEMLALQKVVHKVPVSDYCVNYVATLIRSTRVGDPRAPQFVKDWILWGVGPRGGQSLIASAQARAALDGRPEVDITDIQAMAKAVLRHRIVLNYNAEAQGQTAETVIQKLVDAIPRDAAAEKAHERISHVLKA